MTNRLRDWWHRCLVTLDEAAVRSSAVLSQPEYSIHSDRSLKLDDLEPRVLFSATPIDIAMIPGADEVTETVVEVSPENGGETESDQLISVGTDQSLNEVVIIDPSVKDLEAYLADLSASGLDSNVFVLDADQDGIEQITEILSGETAVDAVHIISHGNNGGVQLGNLWLTESIIDGYAGDIASWGTSLTSEADILFYGCDLAGTASGLDLVESLSVLSGADIAASTNDTGHAKYDADWILEHSTGAIDAQVVVSEDFQNEWIGKLAIINVTTHLDVDDDSDGLTSLREAIIQVNEGSGGDTIVLQANTTYQLTITGSNNDARDGDLDLEKEVTIQGADAETTIIEGMHSNRIFEVRDGGDLTITDVHIKGGDVSAEGGAIYVQHSNAVLTLERVILTNNVADDGGGIHNKGTMTLTDVVIANNGDATTSEGGGIHNKGTATLINVTLSGNIAADGGAIHQDNSASLMTVTNSTISGNEASQKGGGIHAQKDVELNHVTIANNVAVNGGGINNNGGTIDIQNTIIAGNTATSTADVEGSFNSQGNNLISDTNGGSGFVASDLEDVEARLSPLSDSNGFGQVHFLLSNSQAIDAGAATSTATDQRGQARVGTADIGAFEFAPTEIQNNTLFTVTSEPNTEQNTASRFSVGKDSVAMAADGSYVVVWSSDGQDGGGLGVYARRFDASGNPLTGEVQIAQTTATHQRWASVASDQAGNFVVTWTSQQEGGGTNSVYARTFDANGNETGDEFRVNQTNTGMQRDSAIAIDPETGRFTIVWAGEGPGSGGTDGIFYRRFEADGTAVDSNDRVVDVSAGDASSADIALQPDGHFVIAYELGGDVYLKRFDDGGIEIAALQLDDSGATSSLPSIASDQDGNIVVSGQVSNGAVGGIATASFSSTFSGTATFGALTNTSNASNSSVAMTADGDVLLTWEQPLDSDGSGVYGMWITDSSPSVFQINVQESGDQDTVSAAVFDRNNAVAVWTGPGSDGTDDVFARQFGSLPGPSLPPVTTADTATVHSGDSVSIDLTGNDSDPEGNTLTVLDVTSTNNGSITNNLNGTVTYDSNFGFTGTESFQYRVTDGSSGLVHYWGFAGHADDSVGSANGTLNGGPSFQNGSFGDGMFFDENNDYVRVSDFDYNSEFTLTFDFTLDDLAGNDYQYIYSHGSVFGGPGLNIYLGEASASTDVFELQTTFRDNNGTSHYTALDFDISSIVNDGVWHTYTLTVNATDGATVYLDGVQMRQNSAEGDNNFNPFGDLFIGARNDLNSQRYFGGGLDSMQIFDRALTSSEVLDVVAAAQISTESVSVDVENNAPIASTDGPYTINEGDSLSINAATSSDPDDDSRTYRWDINYDGATFVSDVTTESATLTWAQLQTLGISDDGTYDIALIANDGIVDSALLTTTVTVQNVGPTATNDSFNVTADIVSFTTTNVLGNDTDVNNADVLSITGFDTSTSSGLSVNSNGDGTFTITLGNEFSSLLVGQSEVRTFEYTVSDDDGGFDVGTVTVTVDGTNNPVSTNPDFETTNKNTQVSIDLLANDSDVDGDSLTILDVQSPTNGTVTNHYDGTITYNPDTDYVGSDTFNYRVTDGTEGRTNYWGFGDDGNDSIGGSTATINGATFQPGSFGQGLDFDGIDDFAQIPDVDYTNQFTVSIDFKLDDLSGGGQQYLYSHGALDTNNSLNIYIQEASNAWLPGHLAVGLWDSNDTITGADLEYDVSSFVGDGNWHNVTVVVNSSFAKLYIDGSNVQQIANRGGDAMNPAGNVIVGARQNLASDTYFDGQIDSIQVFDRGLTSSQVASLANGSSFTTESVTITTVNQDPTASSNGPFTIDEGESGVALFLDAGSSSDPDNDDLVFAWDIDFDGSFDIDFTTETVSLNWADLQSLGITDEGVYQIRLQVSDGLASDTHTFDLTVNNVDPMSNDIMADQTTDEDAPFTFQFAANAFTDPNDSLTFTTTLADGSNSPLPSWLNFNSSTRTFSGTPTNDDVGTIVIRVTASDGGGGTPATDEFSLTVRNTNDRPTVVSPLGDLTIDEDVPFTFTIPTSTFEDVDGDSLSYSVVFAVTGSGPNTDWLTYDPATRTLSGTPDNNSVGRFDVVVEADDGNGGTETDTFQITVDNVNDAPTITSTQTTSLFNQDFVLSSDRFDELTDDVDNTILTPVVGTVVGGAATVNPDGSVTFTPNDGFLGTASFELQAFDGSLVSNVATVSINIVPQGAPQPTTESSTTPETESESEDDSSSDSSSDSIKGVINLIGGSDDEDDDKIAVGLVQTVENASRASSSENQRAGLTDVIGQVLEDEISKSLGVFNYYSQQASDENHSAGSESRDRSLERGILNGLMDQIDYSFLTQPGEMWTQLDVTQREVDSQITSDMMLIGTMGAATSSLTVGFVAYAIRGGFLLSGLLTHVPMWKAVDPLMIMQGFGGEGESLQQIMEQQAESLTDSSDADA